MQLFQAKLSVIVPMVDSRTHRLHADAEMDNPAMTVMAGMSGEAVDHDGARARMSLAAPEAAVTQKGRRELRLQARRRSGRG